MPCLVAWYSGQADEATQRGTVHDRAAALLLHLKKLMLHAGPHATQIDGIDLVEACGRLFRHWTHWPENACVVIGHVEPAEGRDRAFHHSGGLRLIGDIAGDCDRLVTRLFERFDRRGQGLLIAIGEHNGCAGMSERLSGSKADAGARTCDKSNLAFEFICGIHDLSWVQFGKAVICTVAARARAPIIAARYELRPYLDR